MPVVMIQVKPLDSKPVKLKSALGLIKPAAVRVGLDQVLAQHKWTPSNPEPFGCPSRSEFLLKDSG